MNFYQLLKASLIDPKKQAAARVISIGRIMQFIFLIITAITILSFTGLIGSLQQTTGEVDGLVEYVGDIKWILYPVSFVSLYVSTTLFQFVLISIVALVGLGFLKLQKKRGEYRHVWRTAALAVTFPTILAFAIEFLDGPPSLSLAASLLAIAYIAAAVRFYPNAVHPKKRPQS